MKNEEYLYLKFNERCDEMRFILWAIAACVSGLLAILKLFGLQYSWVIAFSPMLVLLGLQLFVLLIGSLVIILTAGIVMLKDRKKG